MKKFTNSIKDFSKTIGKVIAIPEEDVIYCEDNKIFIFGTSPYYEFIDGKSTKIETTSYTNVKKHM